MTEAKKATRQYDKGQRAYEAFMLWRHNANYGVATLNRMWECLSGEERSAWLVAEHDVRQAAIEALLEPSEAMIAAADRQAEANKSLERGYVDGTYLVLRAAITAALGESE